MSLYKNSDLVLLGGMPGESTGRALGPYRIRTILENCGYSTSIVDYFDTLTLEELKKICDFTLNENTIAVGLSWTWEQDVWKTKDKLIELNNLFKWIKIKNNKVKIIIGSSNLQRIPEELLDECDWVVGGYIEESLPKLFSYIKNNNSDLKFYPIKNKNKIVNFIDSNKDYIVNDCDNLYTKYYKEDNFLSYQPITIELCRGCVFNCAYCTYAFKNKKVFDYIRSAENISLELKRNYDLFGTTRYMLADDTFNDSLEKIDILKRAVDLAKLPNFEYVCYLRPEMLVSKPNMIEPLINLGLRGAHYGIESFNYTTRKLVGRPIPIEKIIDATANLKDKSKKVRICGSLIIGLPGDKQDDYPKWKEILEKNIPHFLDSWWFGPLTLHRLSVRKIITFKGAQPASITNLSPIESNPEKFGYDVTKNYSSTIINWKNEFMTYEEAISLAHYYTNVSTKVHKLAGWKIAAGWYHNLSDDEIYSEPYSVAIQKCVPTKLRKHHWLDIIGYKK